MIREVKGKYLVAGSSRALDARMLFSGADLSIQDGTGKILAVACCPKSRYLPVWETFPVFSVFPINLVLKLRKTTL